MPLENILGDVGEYAHVLLHDLEVACTLVYLFVLDYLLLFLLFDDLGDDLAMELIYLRLQESLLLFLSRHILLMLLHLDLLLLLDLFLFLHFLCLLIVALLSILLGAGILGLRFLTELLFDILKLHSLLEEFIFVTRGSHHLRLGETSS